MNIEGITREEDKILKIKKETKINTIWGKCCYCTNARSLPKNNMLYDLSTMSNELELLHQCLDVVLNKQESSHLSGWM